MKLLHIVGVSLFVGNMLVTAFMKALISIDKSPKLVAFGQRFIGLTDIIFYGIAAILILVSGIYMNPDFLNIKYLNIGFWLFVIIGIIWIAYFIPIQVKQSKIIRENDEQFIPESYWRLEKLWNAGGIVAMVITFSILYFMIYKPL